jgi:hypothetical protein
MIGTQVVRDFPLCDQEILLRALHKVAGEYVDEYRNNGAKEARNGAAV